jgi:hypothetical protein
VTAYLPEDAMRNAVLPMVLSAATVLGAAPGHAQYVPPPPVMKLGQCVQTKISWLGSRLESQDEQPVPGSGSAVQFANGLYQVSYQEEEPVNSSRMGDPVSICLVELPKHCPPGDDRGKTYKTTNLRTQKSWTLADSEHMCGGA